MSMSLFVRLSRGHAGQASVYLAASLTSSAIYPFSFSLIFGFSGKAFHEVE